MQRLTAAILGIACTYSFSMQAMTPQTHEQIEQKIREYVEKERGGGVAVAVVYPDTFAKGGYRRDVFFYGHIKADGSPPPREDTLFYLASLSKTLIATILAKFIKEGKINLDDPAQKYVPEWVHVPSYRGKQITIRELATHTSSLPRVPTNTKRPGHYEVKDLYEFLNHYKLKEAPGTKYLYSNLAFGFLGTILANIAHMNIQELLIKELDNPLGMTDTRLYYSPEQERRRPFFYASGRRVFHSNSTMYPALAGGSSFSSTLQDMSRFLEFNLGLLDSDMNDILPIIQQHAYVVAPEHYMGLAWLNTPLYEPGSVRVFAKNGGFVGLSTFMCFVPETKTGVLVLSNAQVPTPPLGMAIIKLLNPK